jgi:hypothetical protein
LQAKLIVDGKTTLPERLNFEVILWKTTAVLAIIPESSTIPIKKLTININGKKTATDETPAIKPSIIKLLSSSVAFIEMRKESVDCDNQSKNLDIKLEILSSSTAFANPSFPKNLKIMFNGKPVFIEKEIKIVEKRTIKEKKKPK